MISGFQGLEGCLQLINLLCELTLPAASYPILRDLEKSGYIKGHWEIQRNRKLKTYTITKSGELILRRAIVKQAEIFNTIGSLFKEFVRDILNVEAANTPMPDMFSPFTPFLEDNPNSEENLKHLEHDRKHAAEAVKSMRERLKQIDQRIKEIKEQKSQILPSTN